MKEQYIKKTKKELQAIAKKLQIKNISRLKKDDLLNLILTTQEKEKSKNDLKKKEKIIKQSLQEDTQLKGYEKTKKQKTQKKKEEIDIPERYSNDKITILPIDPSKHFVYWDFSDDTMKQLRQYYKIISYAIKLFENGIEVLLIDVGSIYGNYYIHRYAPSVELYVVFGIITPDGFVALKKSNRISTPSDKLSDLTNEEWLKKFEQWEEIVKLSFSGPNHYSSFEKTKKMLEEITKYYKNSISSKGE